MKRAEQAPVLVVGAGVAGLACSRALADAGKDVVVLERARGVGGRCATRRMEGQPVDFGVAFFHGHHAEFLSALDEVPSEQVPGWPFVVAGTGKPCQSEAFTPGERRLAYRDGVQAFPRHLSRGLQVHLQSKLAGLVLDGNHLRLTLEDGRQMEAQTVVLALAPEQISSQLESLAQHPQVASARAVLGLARSQACLVARALYPPAAPVPDWQILFPETSDLLQVISHDSTKRQAPARQALVFQAHAAWSRTHLEDPEWPDLILAEAAQLLGTWAAHPEVVEYHRWGLARSDRSAELAQPMLLELPGGSALGICGDRFAPGGGVEAAWLSGSRLAQRILSWEAR